MHPEAKPKVGATMHTFLPCNARHCKPVRSSVKRVDCDKTKKLSPTFLYHTKDHSL